MRCPDCNEVTDSTDLISHMCRIHGLSVSALQAELHMRNDLADCRNALDASTIAHNRMRDALTEAMEAVARGDLDWAVAAIRRGLGEGER